MSRSRRVARGALTGLAAAAAGYAAARVLVARSHRRPDPYRDHGFETLADSTYSIESGDGTQLHVIERGAGIPVVMGHGVSIDRRTWVHQLEDLPDAGIRAVVFDQRGHGASSVGSSGFGLQQLADDLRAILESLDLSDAVLVGHSMGGIGVQSFAALYPDLLRERVAGIVLMSTLARAPRGLGPLDRALDERFATRGDAAFARLLARRNAGFLVARAGFGRRPHVSHVEVTRRMIGETQAATRAGAMRPLVGFDLVSSLERISVPTLVVCGTADVLTPAGVSRRMAARIPGARLELLPGVGHMPMYERAETVNRLIAEFAHEVVGSGRAAARR